MLELQDNFLKNIAMNKFYIFFIFLLICSMASSQILDEEINTSYKKERKLKKKLLNDKAIKEYSKNDTLFILFKKSKFTDKRISIQEKKYNKIKFTDTIRNYNYALKDSSYFSFVHQKYFDFDQIESNSSSLILVRNKSFLRKRKLLTHKFLKKYKHYETGYLLSVISEIVDSKKIIFIIDKGEFSGKKIILRQVMLDGSSNHFFIDRI